MELKPSRYNFFIPHGSKYLIYNSFSNALAQIDSEHYDQYQSFLNSASSLDDNFKENLLYGGYIVDKEIDELDMIKENRLKSKFIKDKLLMTVAPTLKCNFRCPYCYEQGVEQVGTMSEEVQSQLMDFIEKRISDIKNFDLTWIGGEPLLAIDVIDSLTEKILSLCKKYDVNYKASMVSNGYLLNEDIIQRLKKNKVESIQITLDGPPEKHNQKRIMPNGEPTFDRILENIKKVSEEMKVAIRVNVDKHNLEQSNEVIDIILDEGLKDSVVVYFANVEDFSGHEDTETNCISTERFSKHNMILRKKLLEAGLKTDLEYPHRKGVYCGAETINNFSIDPLGYIYKCWSDIGFHHKAIAELDEDETFENKYKHKKNLYSYLLYDPTEDKKCSNCKILPLCMGGCPFLRISNKEHCTQLKYKLDETIQEVVQYELHKKINNGSV